MVVQYLWRQGWGTSSIWWVSSSSSSRSSNGGLWHRSSVLVMASSTGEVGEIDLQCLCRAGRMREVLDVLEKGGMSVSNRFYAQAMSKCGKMKDLCEAKRLHRHMVEGRLELDGYLGSGMVEMYVQCGSVADAQLVHDRLPEQNEYAWTALISGYVGCGQAGEALRVYEEMRGKGVKASTYTFVHALKACGSLGDLGAGRAVHVDVSDVGKEGDVYVGTALIDMYAKCGSVLDARDVFDKLAHRNVVTWNAMILGYAEEQAGGGLALQLYARMQREGVVPDDRTFVGVLKACGSLTTMEEGMEVNGKLVKAGCVGKGRSIHARLLNGGFESNVFVGTTLVDVYVKCGCMLDAHQVFDKLQHRNVVSWNVMILGYSQKEEGELALQLYAQMQDEGIVPNDGTFVGVLKACSGLAMLEEGTEVVKMSALEKGRSIHAEALKRGCEAHLAVVNTLIDMYAKCGSMVDAWYVFGCMPHSDVVSWNVIISGYAEKQEAMAALRLYAHMLETGLVPDDWTFVGALKACSSLATMEEGVEVDGKSLKIGCLEKGREIHSHVLKAGSCQLDVFVGNTLIDMYAKCGSMVDARHVFDRLSQRDVVSWNVMILGYAEVSEVEEALKLYAQMQEQGLAANSVTFVSILKACGNSAALETGRSFHMQLCRADIDRMVASALVDMYGKCGSMADAQQVFDALPMRDVVTWNALIAGYGRQGKSELVFHLLDRMNKEGVHPNGVTFLSVLTVCSHVGLVGSGQDHFHAMTTKYGLTPSIEHYSCMADLLGRAGHLDEAMAIVETMPSIPNLVTWMTLLGACRKWRNVRIGRRAFESAVALDEKHAAAYILMSNIYADALMWEDREKIQGMRENAGAWKKPGQSWWTEVGGMVHRFMVADTKHPQSRAIYAKLKELSS